VDDAPLLESLRRAVAREPEDATLRLHLAQALVDAGLGQEAVGHLGRLLADDPRSTLYLDLMRTAMGGPPQAVPSSAAPAHRPHPATMGPRPAEPGFDWGAAEDDLTGGLAHDPVDTSLRLADVAGLDEVKAHIEGAFLTPLRNPELRARYGASLRGGLLLYGPPGCGKTYLARAVAGELGARFISVGLSDVLSRWMGESENNIAELFSYARQQAPCVLFFDEIDALGRSRSGLGRSASALRGVINQLLAELDGVASHNEGIFVLGATNAPWDVDGALRRPGRFDRAVFVEPPDEVARAEILRLHLADLPQDPGIDLGALAARTDTFSGADLAHVARSAAQTAMLDAARTGSSDRAIGMGDLEPAVSATTPSTGRWFNSARNVVLFADSAGEYSALADYMRAHRLL
jgi:AAA+ superfamily predicted ATPase